MKFIKPNVQGKNDNLKILKAQLKKKNLNAVIITAQTIQCYILP